MARPGRPERNRAARSFHQQQQNCCSWFLPGDIARGDGEALSIREMVEHAVAAFGTDRRNPVQLLAEMRAAQEELGERIGGLAPAASGSPADPLAFARSLGTIATTTEVRATHRRPKRRYKKRIRMPSKLDPYLATIENWLAVEPQITARLLRSGHHIHELPVHFAPRSKAEGKKIKWRDGVRALQVLLQERFSPQGEL